MKGEGLGSLLVYEVNDGKTLIETNLKYNVTGHKGDAWLKAQMTLFGTNNTVQVSLKQCCFEWTYRFGIFFAEPHYLPSNMECSLRFQRAFEKF